MVYEFAGFPIEFKNTSRYFEKKCIGYEIENINAVAEFEITELNVEHEMRFAETGANKNIAYFSAGLRYIAEWLPLNSACVFHGACFDIDGQGIIFTAKSGTGKTTHMRLWKELLGDKMVIVNGDKPIVRFFDDEPNTPYAYGTPWNGKERLGCNMRTPLKHICFIERSETNFVEKMDKSDVVDRVFNQVYMPKDAAALMKTMELIDRLLSCCNLWIIHCNMEKDAAKIAYESIFNA